MPRHLYVMMAGCVTGGVHIGVMSGCLINVMGVMRDGDLGVMRDGN